MAKLSTTSVFGDLLVDGMIHGNVTGNLTGNASTATSATTATSAGKWSTARTITIGSKGKSVDGSGNVSWTLSEIGAAPASHTHNYAGSSSAGGAANSVKTNLIIKLNGGSTEGTNLFTFNGSTAKTVNITPSAIGAAGSSHGTHVTYSTSAPLVAGTAAVGSANNVARGDHVHPLQTTVSGNAGTATKLATARTITIGNKSNSFDGSANISYTLADIGAATSGHTHKYAGSSSAGGAANSAVKLSSARTINGTSFDGSANITTANWGTARKINQISVNGSADVKLPLDYYTCNIGSSNAKPYHHILTTGQCTGSWTDKSITIVLVNHYNSAGLGIAKATLRTNDATNGGTANGEIKWLVRSGFAENSLCFNIRNTAKDAYMDVFYKATGTYNSLTWYVLTEGARGSHGSQWTKYNTHHDNGTNVYNEAGMKAIRTYTSTLQSATDDGSVNSAKTAATCLGNAATATTLKTARNIALGGLLSGSASFNGSANITINASVAAPPKSGDWWSGGIPTVSTGGVMEVGKYIDFHNTDTSTNDYDVRLQANTSTPCVINLPSGGGTLARTSDSITGNAATSTKLATARTLTIGNKGKTFDGSANQSWSLSEIGAAAASHNHGLLHDNFTVELANTTTDNGWSMINSSYNGHLLKSIRFNASVPPWAAGGYGAGIAFGGGDTKGVVSMQYSSPLVKFAGGNGTKPVWNMGITGTSGKNYNLEDLNFLGGQLTGTNANIGTLSSLKTTAKGSLVEAINELFQSANNGKQLIASAIGTPLSSSDTFSAMSDKINSLLNTFKTNMMINGVSVGSEDKFKSLIDKIATLADSEDKGIQYAEGTFEDFTLYLTTSGSYVEVPYDLDFTPTLLFVKFNYINNTKGTTLSNPYISNKGYTNFYMNYGLLVGIQNISSNGFQIFSSYGGNSDVTFKGVTWYAIGVGEESNSGLDIISATTLPATGKENQLCVITSTTPNRFVIADNSADTEVSDNIVRIRTTENAACTAYTYPMGNIFLNLRIAAVYQNRSAIPLWLYRNNEWIQICFTSDFALKDKVVQSQFPLATDLQAGCHFHSSYGITITDSTNSCMLTGMPFQSAINFSKYKAIRIKGNWTGGSTYPTSSYPVAIGVFGSTSRFSTGFSTASGFSPSSIPNIYSGVKFNKYTVLSASSGGPTSGNFDFTFDISTTATCHLGITCSMIMTTRITDIEFILK